MSDRDEDVVRVTAGCQHGLHGTRIRNGKAQPCSMVPVEEGRPIQPGDELIRLRIRNGERNAFDVEVVCSGPPKVASPAYRRGWDATFKRGDTTLN